MARIRVRFELNKGRTGAPLSKLGKIAEQAERFLKALAAGAEIDQNAGQWLAVDFENGSVSYDAVFQGEVTPIQAQVFNRHLEFVVDYDPESEGANGMVRDTTLSEFAKLGTLIDPDEIIGLGVYRTGVSKPVMRQFTYHKAAQIRQEITAPLPTYGALQGIIHSLQKEVRQPNFVLRELATDSLVRCFYSLAQYGAVARALQERSTVVHASGQITYDRATRVATEMRLERLERARVLPPSEFEALFGSAPDFTGDLTTEEYVEMIREDG